MKLRISNISLCLLPLFLWSFQVSAQIPGTVQFDTNNFAQELIRENRERQLSIQREMAESAASERAEIAALDQPTLAQQKALETLEQESYIRLNLNRCLQAQLPQGFCNLLIQPP